MQTLKKIEFQFFFSALILSLAFNFPQELGFLCLIFLLPIFISLEKINVKTSNKKIFTLTFFFTFIFSILSTTWFVAIHPLTWAGIDNNTYSLIIVFGLWILLGIFMALPMSFWGLVLLNNIKKIKLVNILLIAFSWILLEFFRSLILAFALFSNEVLFGPHHTYYSLAYLLSEISILKNLLSGGGIYLGSFCIILINFVFYLAILHRRNGDIKTRKILINLFFLVSIIILISNFATLKYKTLAGKNTESVYISNSKFESSKNKLQSDLKNKTAIKKINEILKIKNSGGDIFILPENFDVYNIFKTNKKTFIKDIFVIGSFSAEKENMYFLDTKNESVGIYEKQLLMPIGEYKVKYIQVVDMIFDFLSKKEKTLETTIKKGKSANTYQFEKSNLIFISSICSENISPYLYKNGVSSGGNIILNIASHGPFRGSLSLERQTLAINKTRAIENGKYFITNSNYGDTFLISPFGETVFYIKNSDIENQDLKFYSANISSENFKTIYSVFGDYILIIGFIFIIIYTLRQEKIKNPKTK